MQIIDPHLHLFNLAEGDYHWLRPENPPHWPDKAHIYRSYGELDLRLEGELQLAGLVHIEAGFDNRQPWREIAWLEKSVKKPLRSIAAVDLTLSSERFNRQLEKLASFNSVVGVRDILDQQATSYLTNAQVVANLGQLQQRGWLFECQYDLANTRATKALLQLLEHTSLEIVINHAGFPNATSDENWLWSIQQLARYLNVSCKASGWEMLQRSYPQSAVVAVLEALLREFDEERVMLASNFPLCEWRASYGQLWQSYAELPLDKSQVEKLMLHNARRVYRF